ncbi:MAG: hypothetical protein AB7G75_34865 [Candidatus Binatia bacterium]
MHPLFFNVAILSWFVFSIVPACAQGSLYKWVDPQGTVHYTNAPTQDTARSVDDTLPPASAFQSPTPPPEIAESPSEPTEATPPSVSKTPTSEDVPVNDDTPEQATAEPSEESQPDDPEIPTLEDQEPAPASAQDDSGTPYESSE